MQQLHLQNLRNQHMQQHFGTVRLKSLRRVCPAWRAYKRWRVPFQQQRPMKSDGVQLDPQTQSPSQCQVKQEEQQTEQRLSGLPQLQHISQNLAAELYNVSSSVWAPAAPVSSQILH